MAKARILVVDDDPRMTRAVRRALMADYVVAEAQAPDQALEALEKHAPELAILDISMPLESGFALMDRLRAGRPDLDIIFMTGSVDAESVHMVRAIEKGAFYYIQKPFQNELLLALVGRCLALRTTRRDLERRTAHHEKELKAAQKFQRSMLPPEHARCGPIELRACYRSCHEVGGDLYDYHAAEGPGGYVAVLLADIAGKGAGAAMLTSAIRYAFRTASSDAHLPSVVAQRILASIPVMDTHHFATAACVRIHPASRELDYVNAGHLPIALMRADGSLEMLDSTGVLLNPHITDHPWEQRRVAFGPGDRLLIYSDGVVEAMRPQRETESGEVLEREMFGDARLEAAVRAAPPGGWLMDAVLEHLAAFQGEEKASDDVTLLEVRFGM